MLEMKYFCAELVQLIVSQSDSELEVHRYVMKKNTLTVNPIMLEDEHSTLAAISDSQTWLSPLTPSTVSICPAADSSVPSSP